MSRKRLVFICFVVILAVCVGFVGCGMVLFKQSSEDAKAPVLVVDEPVFDGTWELDSAVCDGEPRLVDELIVVRSLHMTRYLTLDEDGSATLELLGATLKGTWRVDENGVGHMLMGLSKLDDFGFVDEWVLSLDGDVLVVSGGGWELRLFRIDAANKQHEDIDLNSLKQYVH